MYMASAAYRGNYYWPFVNWYRTTPYAAQTYLWQPGYMGQPGYPITNYINGYANFNGWDSSMNIGLNFSWMNHD